MIQMYDEHGQPLMPAQELKRLELFFGNLFQDSTFQYPGNFPLIRLPFVQEDILQGLRQLPVMKALAPPRHACPPSFGDTLHRNLRVRSISVQTR